jgi:hypothetical protein
VEPAADPERPRFFMSATLAAARRAGIRMLEQ